MFYVSDAVAVSDVSVWVLLAGTCWSSGGVFTVAGAGVCCRGSSVGADGAWRVVNLVVE